MSHFPFFSWILGLRYRWPGARWSRPRMCHQAWSWWDISAARYGGFHKWGYPQMDGLQGKVLWTIWKLMTKGYASFRKPPYSHSISRHLLRSPYTLGPRLVEVRTCDGTLRASWRCAPVPQATREPQNLPRVKRWFLWPPAPCHGVSWASLGWPFVLFSIQLDHLSMGKHDRNFNWSTTPNLVTWAEANQLKQIMSPSLSSLSLSLPLSLSLYLSLSLHRHYRILMNITYTDNHRYSSHFKSLVQWIESMTSST